MIRTFSLIQGDTHYGPHVWDDEAGVVTSGIRADELNFTGSVSWSHPNGIGCGTGATIALRSNDGMIAMLLLNGYAKPPELEVEDPPEREPPVDGVLY